MDTTSCGVNTWRPEDNDDWLMNRVNHVLASLTRSIFPRLSSRFSCSARADPHVRGHALNHVKQPQITARSSNPCLTRWGRHKIIPTRWLKKAAVIWNKWRRFHRCDAAQGTLKEWRGRCVELDTEICLLSLGTRRRIYNDQSQLLILYDSGGFGEKRSCIGPAYARRFHKRSQLIRSFAHAHHVIKKKTKAQT